jgi:hypothetical protein
VVTDDGAVTLDMNPSLAGEAAIQR